MAEEASTLQFGIQSTTATWVAFNNMVLKYKGKDAVAAKRTEFQQLLQTAADYLASLDGEIPSSILDDANDKLLEMDQEYDSVEEYQQAINAVQELMANAEECATVYESIQADITQLSEKLNTHQNEPDAETWAGLSNRVNETALSAESSSSIEQLNECSLKLEAIAYEFGFAIASPEEPFEYYTSGDATDFEGWITGGTSDSNNGNNLWYVTTRTSAPTGNFYEMWGSDATNYAYREATLPVGLYKLSVNIASSETCEFVFDVATSPIEAWGEGQIAESEYFGVLEEKTVQFGIQSVTANWVCFNNLTLLYLGSDIPDAIDGNEMTAEKNSQAVTTTITGINVAAPAYPGIYIIGGKKVFVK